MEVTRRGAEVVKTPEVMKLVRRDLVVTPFSPQQAFPQSYRMFCETPTRVIVPLYWAKNALAHLAATDKRAGTERRHLEFVGELKPELRQPDAVAAVTEAWKRTGGATLCLPTGYGKTTTGLYLACHAGCRTLILVHKDFLARQWEERIRQFVPSATVTRVQGGECDTSGDFVIAMLQTLVSRKYPASTFAECGLLIVDESHHIAAQAFSQTLWSLCAPLTLGLTATPERKDRLGRVVEWFVGPIAYQIKREHQAGTVVAICRYASPRYGQPPPLNRRGDVCFTSIVTELAQDPARTALAVAEAVRMARAGRDVLVLSHRRGHCADIAEGVRAQGLTCATYLGGDKTVPNTNVIVATYSLTSEGFDCPRLTGLVLATPASDVEQACGRVMRGSSSQSAEIVDIVDAWGVCYAQHAKRKAFYKRCGFVLQARQPEARSPPKMGFAFVDEPAG